MKRYLSVLIASMLACAGLAGCGSTEKVPEKEDDRIQIVTTIFPEYDWVKEIVGDREDVEVTMLLDDGVDLHSFQPTAKDMAKVAEADLFIYVGGESDEWVGDALKEVRNPDQKAINLLEVLGKEALTEETIEGMQEEDEEGEHEAEEELDEHVWLSLRNAEVFVKTIAEACQEIDSEHKEEYQTNAEEYIQKLGELDGAYKDMIKGAEKDTILFGDRFPFRYMTEDYGLSYYAAFAGCSAETEASFETITFLAEKMDEQKLDEIMVLDHSDEKIAKAIIDNTERKNQEIVTMNSMQSVTLADAEKGVTYLSVMEENLKALEKALD